MKKQKSKNKKSRNLGRLIENLLNQKPKKEFNYKQISALLGFSEAKEKNEIQTQLVKLVEGNRIEKVREGKYRASKKTKTYQGIIRLKSGGDGYFISDHLDEEILVQNRDLNQALHGDEVIVSAYNRKNRLEGEVIEILKREKQEFVGVLQLHENFGFVIPDNPKMYADIFIDKKQLKNVDEGLKVLAEITDWPSNSKNPFGKILKVIGPPDHHETEIHSILLEYNLPIEFPKEVEHELLHLSSKITDEEISKRKDLRSTLTFTIDPKDAKDFDDAISIKELDNGNIELGVHIADVTHYVQENTELDKEAYRRATSVYLVDRVVPMLPEVLSNGVCSLSPHEDKLTFSVIFEISPKAEIVNYWMGKTIISSDKRFSYEEAQEIIETETYRISKENSLTGKSYLVDKSIADAIISLNKIAKVIRKERIKNGAIVFDKTEIKFNLDEQSEPTEVYFKKSLEANKLIEEFMLLANKVVATSIGKKEKGKPTKIFVYRIHDEPDLDKLIRLQEIAKKLGYPQKIDTRSKLTTARSLNSLLEAVKGKDAATFIETLAIRSMSKAEYSTENIGHYGLAFDFYSHFTSPIRRYPDMMVHRLLEHYLAGGKTSQNNSFEEKCKHVSEQEFRATKAERDSTKYMQVKYMQQHKNKLFKGVISGVTEWGVYVEITENMCEGLCRVRDMKDDFYLYDETNYALVGQSTGNQYQLGNHVTIQVIKTNLKKKQLDFKLVKKESNSKK